MKTTNSPNTLKKSIIRVVTVTALILMIPLIAMQFSDEVDWKVLDFVIIGGLLVGTGFIYELAVRKIQNTTHRIVLSITLFAVLFLIWAELAVGIFGTPFAGS